YHSHGKKMPSILSAGLGVLAAANFALMLNLPVLDPGTYVLKLTALAFFGVEAFGAFVWKISQMGLSFYYLFKPVSNAGKARLNTLVFGQHATLMAASLGLSYLIYPAFARWFMAGADTRFAMAYYSMFWVSTALLNAGIWTGLVYLASEFKARNGIRKPKGVDVQNVAEAKEALLKFAAEPNGYMVINYVGSHLGLPVHNLKNNPEEMAKAVKAATDQLKFLVDDGDDQVKVLLNTFRTSAERQGIPVEKDLHRFIDVQVTQWMELFYRRSIENKMDLWNRVQLSNKVSAQNQFAHDPSEKEILFYAMNIERLLSLMMGTSVKGINTYDLGVNLMEVALMVKELGLTDKVAVAITINKYQHQPGTVEEDAPGHPKVYEAKPELSLMNKYLDLFKEVSGGSRIELAYSSTASATKSGTMNSLLAYPDLMRKMTHLHVLDRNANGLELRKSMQDSMNMMDNPHVVIMVAHRNTTNTRRYIGEMNRLVESGQGAGLQGFVDMMATGWQNRMGVYSYRSLLALSNPHFWSMPVTEKMHQMLEERIKNDPQLKQYYILWKYFGMQGFMPNAIFISEDWASAIQHASMLISLGIEAEFALSESLNHKRRETFSPMELSAAPPRWVGGRGQVDYSERMQSINQLGAESYMMREATRNTGRTYTALALGYFFIANTLISTVFDYNPFSLVDLSLLFAATNVNQIMRLLGYKATKDDSGWFFGTARSLNGL
ncbi:MAG: hypothetical protein HQL15_11090, partial [Candidatus Omnitrophica bacterium]|nr:hypothetical protein [Candidatus Omnitrophota bacterium]